MTTDVTRGRAACLILLALYVLLFAFNTVTRIRNFSDPDTMNFVDIARHIVSGQGVRQATLGFNQPVFGIEDPIPTPLTHQPPLYPLAVAALARAGVSVEDAAVLISVVCYGFILLAGYCVAARLFGTREALAAVGLLALYSPLREFSESAFSEPAGLALMFASLWLLAAYATAPMRTAYLATFAGLCAAAAVATRYALAPLVVVGIWFIMVQGTTLDERERACGMETRGGNYFRIRDTALFLLAPGVTAVLLAVRNLSILNGALTPHYLPSTTGYLGNFRGAIGSLVSQYAGHRFPIPQFLLLLAALAGLLYLARKHGRWRQAVVACWLTGRGAQLLTAFALAYLLFLIVQRSHSYIDAIGPRYLLPAASVLVVLFAAFAVRASDISLRTVALAGCLGALGLLVCQARSTLVTPAYAAQRQIDDSERLRWIQSQTTENDVIIGEDTVDVPFYFKRTAAVSYSVFPYTQTLPYDKLLGLCRRFGPQHRRVLLILRHHELEQSEKWLLRLGPFIKSASAGQIDDYPALSAVASWRDGVAYRVSC